MLFDIIVSDPPWKFASNSKAKPGRNAMRHYDCMTDAEIKAVNVPAKPDALLFMWTTAPMLARAMPVLNAWGFKYVSQLVWVKPNIATGYWVRNRHEIVLIAKRGKFPCVKPAPFADSVIIAPTGQHSQKPEVLLGRIDEMWPDADRLEMFARRKRVGWNVWGNQTDMLEATT